MRNTASTGTLIAAMAAGLFTAGVAAPSQAADSDKVHCHGVNSCKGQGACGSADHACAGKNACKGKGFVEVTAKECKEKGGTVEAPPAPANKAPKKK